MKFISLIRKKIGLTLIELLIGVAIFSLIMVASISLYLALKEAFTTETETVSNLIRQARYAVDLLAKDVREAGFRCWPDNPETKIDEAQPRIAYAGPYDLVFNADLDVYQNPDIADPDRKPLGPINPNGAHATVPDGANGASVPYLYRPDPNLFQMNFNIQQPNVGAETVRFTLDFDDDGVVSENDHEHYYWDFFGIKDASTFNPADYILWKKVQGFNGHENVAPRVQKVCTNFHGWSGPYDDYPDYLPRAAGTATSDGDGERDRPMPLFLYWGHFKNDDTSRSHGGKDDFIDEPIDLYGDQDFDVTADGWGELDQDEIRDWVKAKRPGIANDVYIDLLRVRYDPEPPRDTNNDGVLNCEDDWDIESDDRNGNGKCDDELEDVLHRIDIAITLTSGEPGSKPNMAYSNRGAIQMSRMDASGVPGGLHPELWYYKEVVLQSSIQLINVIGSGQTGEILPPTYIPSPSPTLSATPTPTKTPTPPGPTSPATDTPHSTPTPTPGVNETPIDDDEYPCTVSIDMKRPIVGSSYFQTYPRVSANTFAYDTLSFTIKSGVSNTTLGTGNTSVHLRRMVLYWMDSECADQSMDRNNWDNFSKPKLLELYGQIDVPLADGTTAGIGYISTGAYESGIGVSLNQWLTADNNYSYTFHNIRFDNKIQDTIFFVLLDYGCYQNGKVYQKLLYFVTPGESNQFSMPCYSFVLPILDWIPPSLLSDLNVSYGPTSYTDVTPPISIWPGSSFYVYLWDVREAHTQRERENVPVNVCTISDKGFLTLMMDEFGDTGQFEVNPQLYARLYGGWDFNEALYVSLDDSDQFAKDHNLVLRYDDRQGIDEVIRLNYNPTKFDFDADLNYDEVPFPAACSLPSFRNNCCELYPDTARHGKQAYYDLPINKSKIVMVPGSLDMVQTYNINDSLCFELLNLEPENIKFKEVRFNWRDAGIYGCRNWADTGQTDPPRLQYVYTSDPPQCMRGTLIHAAAAATPIVVVTNPPTQMTSNGRIGMSLNFTTLLNYGIDSANMACNLIEIEIDYHPLADSSDMRTAKIRFTSPEQGITTPTITQTPTITPLETATALPTHTKTPTVTQTPTPSGFPTWTPIETPSPTPTPPWADLSEQCFSDDFLDGNLDGWTVDYTDDWQVPTGYLVGDSRRSNGSNIYAGDLLWQNYRIHANISPILSYQAYDQIFAGILFRALDKQRYTVAELQRINNKWYIAVISVNGNQDRYLAQAELTQPINLGTYYELNVTVTDTRFRIEIGEEGQPSFQTLTGEDHLGVMSTDGMIGLRVAWTKAYFDDFRVWCESGHPPTRTPPPSPTETASPTSTAQPTYTSSYTPYPTMTPTNMATYTPTPTAFPAPCLESNFEPPNYDTHWVPDASGYWVVSEYQPGEWGYQGTHVGLGRSIAKIGSEEWKDYIIEVDLPGISAPPLPQELSFGFIFRSIGSQYYLIEMNRLTSGFWRIVYAYYDGAYHQETDQLLTAFDPSDSYTVRIWVEGNRLTLNIIRQPGALIFDHTHNMLINYPKGNVGLYVENSTMLFDNFTVYCLDIPPAPTPTTTPTVTPPPTSTTAPTSTISPTPPPSPTPTSTHTPLNTYTSTPLPTDTPTPPATCEPIENFDAGNTTNWNPDNPAVWNAVQYSGDWVYEGDTALTTAPTRSLSHFGDVTWDDYRIETRFRVMAGRTDTSFGPGVVFRRLNNNQYWMAQLHYNKYNYTWTLRIGKWNVFSFDTHKFTVTSIPPGTPPTLPTSVYRMQVSVIDQNISAQLFNAGGAPISGLLRYNRSEMPNPAELPIQGNVGVRVANCRAWFDDFLLCHY